MKTHSSLRRIITTLFVTLLLCNLTGMHPAAHGKIPDPWGRTKTAIATGGQPHLEGQLNINHASEAQWILLPGIGTAIAKRILDYRARRFFGSISQVRRIKGIGPKKYQKIKRFLSLSGETTLKTVSTPSTIP